jgi:hypothetical protein
MNHLFNKQSALQEREHQELLQGKTVLSVLKTP